jgi:DNA-binding PadR family transcriptional regulator
LRVARSRALSRQALAVLDALVESRQAWRHGYELAQLTGLRSGTLYPLLIRLEAMGYLEAEWQPPAAPGRPPRHAYRLTADGVARAIAEQASRPGARARAGEALS